MNARDSEDECVAWEGRRWLVLPFRLSRAFFFPLSSLATSTKSAQKYKCKIGRIEKQ